MRRVSAASPVQGNRVSVVHHRIYIGIDVNHMTDVWESGPGAVGLANRSTPNDNERIGLPHGKIPTDRSFAAAHGHVTRMSEGYDALDRGRDHRHAVDQVEKSRDFVASMDRSAAYSDNHSRRVGQDVQSFLVTPDIRGGTESWGRTDWKLPKIEATEY